MIGLISVLLCLITTAAIWHSMHTQANGNSSSRAKFIVPWALAMLAMIAVVLSRIFVDEGINLEFYNSLLLVSFVISGLLFLTSLLKPVEHLGLIVLPATALCLIMNLLFLQPGPPSELSSGIQSHIIASITAFSILCLAAAQAILLYFQERVLKHHSNTGILRALPSLHENETMLFQTISLGVIILTIALVTGFIYLDDIFAQHLAHKTALSSLAWIVFVILLWGRMQFGWRGSIAIRWSLAGFTFLILAYFGSKFVLELVLYNA